MYEKEGPLIEYKREISLKYVNVSTYSTLESDSA